VTVAVTRRSGRRVLAIALGLGVVAFTFAYVLPKIANYGSVWDVLKGLTWPQMLALAAATLANIATYAPPLMAALPGIGFRPALTVTLTSTASTYIAPGGAGVGIAVSFAMLRAWRFGAGAVGLAVAVMGVWNQLFLLGAPALALGLLTLSGEHNDLLDTVALIGFVVFSVALGVLALALRSAELARKIGDLAARGTSGVLRVVRRGPVRWGGESLVAFRSRTIGLLRARWWFLTVATLAGQLTVFAVLLVSLRTLDVSRHQVSLVEAFAAWSIVRLLGSLPVTPGGVGIVEVGLTGALIGFGGRHAAVVAAVLLYRFLTIVPTVALGVVAGATWRRYQRSAGERRDVGSRGDDEHGMAPRKG
jgi:putative heme transporter